MGIAHSKGTMQVSYIEPSEFMKLTVFDVSDPAVIQSRRGRRNREKTPSSGAKSLLEILLDRKAFLPKTVSQAAGLC